MKALQMFPVTEKILTIAGIVFITGFPRLFSVLSCLALQCKEVRICKWIANRPVTTNKWREPTFSYLANNS
jgi:hypothetical protein